MSDLISRSIAMENYCNALCPKLQKGEYCNDCIVKAWLNNQPIAYDPDEAVENLRERTDFLKNCTKYGNKNAEQQEKSYSTMMMYEVADLVNDLIEIVKAGGENEI